MTTCPLIHCHCSACGTAIHTDGHCNCPDNRKHPIATLQSDQITKLRTKWQQLREEILHHPKWDNDRINETLNIIDQHTP